MDKKSNLFIIIFIYILIFSLEQKNFNVLETWDDIEIDVDGKEHFCKKCIPYEMKITKKSNKEIVFLSIPRIFELELYEDEFYIKDNEIASSFIMLKPEYSHYWVPWPNDAYALHNEKEKIDNLKLYSVMGFDIDNSQNFYLLDQGIILKENNTIMKNTSKLLIININNQNVLKKVYNFNETDFNTSLLTDIVVDQSMKFAYITDSGILLNNQSIPRLIVIDLEKEKIYKILNNNENFKHNENISVFYSDNDMYNYFTNITGLNNIQITCDGEMIYFSSLKSKNIFTVLTKDISEAIKKYEETKDENYLNNIKMTIVNKNIVTQYFLLTSKNNIYMTNGENGSIRISYFIDHKDLLNYNFNDYSEIKPEKYIINWASGIDIYNGTLYLLDNHYYSRDKKRNETNNTYEMIRYNDESEEQNDTIGIKSHTIYYVNLSRDELPFKMGCTIYLFKFNIFSIFLWSWFGIILFIVIFLIFINYQEHKEGKEKKKIEEDENVNELNKRLNEKDE